MKNTSPFSLRRLGFLKTGLFVIFSGLLALNLSLAVSVAVFDGGAEDGGGGGGGGGGGSPATATLSASPTSITQGNGSVLSWSSLRAYSCAGVNFNTGNLTSGSVTVYPSSTTTYTITCYGTYGNGSASRTITVSAPAPAPTVSLSASPTSITAGLSSTLTWSSTNATSCTGSGTGFSTGGLTGGTDSVSPGSSTTYTVTCSGSGGSANASRTVTVTNPSAPTVSFSASPSTITSGQSATLTWSSSGATSCTGTNFSTGGATSGSVTVSPTTGTTYSVICYGSTGAGTGTWQLSWSDISDLSCPVTNPNQVYSSMAWCSSSNPTGQSCSTSSPCKWNTISGCNILTDVFNCQGYSPPPATSQSASITVNSLPDLVASAIGPTSGTQGTPMTVSATVTNNGGTSASQPLYTRFQISSNSSGTANLSTMGVHTRSSSLGGSGASYSASVPFTPSFTGTYYIRACADTDTAGAGRITESNESNNCTAWTAISIPSTTEPWVNVGCGPIDWTYNASCNMTQEHLDISCPAGQMLQARSVYDCSLASNNNPFRDQARCVTDASCAVPSPTVILSASPSSITSGNSSTLSWTSTNSSQCTGTNFNTGGATSGTRSVSPTGTTEYGISCVGSPTAAGVWQYYGVEIDNYGCAYNPSWVQSVPYCGGSAPGVTPSGACTASQGFCKVSAYGITPSGSCLQDQSLSDELNVYQCSSSAGDTASVSVTIPPIIVSCSASPTTAGVGQNVTWSASASGGTAPYTYEWIGDNLNGLTGTPRTVAYTSSGTKTGSVRVTDSSAIPSSTTLNQSWTWVRKCSGTYTGHQEGSIEDGGSWANMRNALENGSFFSAFSPAPSGYTSNPENYCVEGRLRQDCPPSGTGTCYYYFDWKLYQGTGTVAATSADVNSTVCNQAQGGFCAQNTVGVRLHTVTNNPSVAPLTVTQQCSNTVSVAGADLTAGAVTPTSASVGSVTTLSATISNIGNATTVVGSGSSFVKIALSTLQEMFASLIEFIPNLIERAHAVDVVFCSASPSSPAVGESVTWTVYNNVEGPFYPEPESYTWSGIDGLTGSTQSVSKTYTTSGLKTAGVQIRWSSGGTSLASCDVSVSGASPNTFTNLFQIDNDSDHSTVTATRTDTSPLLAASATDVSSVSYLFDTPGTWYVRACADNNASWIGTITETNEGNNCGPWTTITVTDPVPQCRDGANNDPDAWTDHPADPGCTDPDDPTEDPNPECSDGASNDGDGLIDCADPGCWAVPGNSGSCDPSDDTEDPNPPSATFTCTSPAGCVISPGGSATLTWNTTGYANCTGGGFSTGSGSPADGSASVSPLVTTPYGLTCDGVPIPPVTVSVRQPHAYIEAVPARVNAGQTASIRYSAAQVTTCSVTGTDGYSANPVPDVSLNIATTSVNRTISKQTTYTISCDGGAATSRVIVNTTPQFQEF